MKTKFNKTWLIVSIVIVFNIVIFSFLSERLESYFADDFTEKFQIEQNS